MSGSGDFDVTCVAQLARIELSPAEMELFQKQLGDILGYVRKLNELDISGVQADTDPLSLLNVWRNDEPRDWFTADDALRNAPRHSKNQFIVPKVME